MRGAIAVSLRFCPLVAALGQNGRSAARQPIAASVQLADITGESIVDRHPPRRRWGADRTLRGDRRCDGGHYRPMTAVGHERSSRPLELTAASPQLADITW
jgi:hypothetical protein